MNSSNSARWTRTFLSLLCAAMLLLHSAHATQQDDASRTEALRAQARAALAQTSGEISVAGLRQPVEILRDTWGVPHIYAKSQRDLFFAQGYVAAQDRLWQLDVWRRIAEGRLAEILGASAVERDRVARLLRFRGDWNAEWRSYSPDTREIATAFTDGINAYIAQVTAPGGTLPIEFQLLGVKPEPWTPEVVVSRMAAYAMTSNASNEVQRAQAIQNHGIELANKLLPPDPPHQFAPAQDFALEGITGAILARVEAAAGAVRFPDLQGSNNWAVAGARTATGKPILAGDPHRALQLPSLRYIVHLNAPGWNVIGAGEPALPGVSMGHNERIAFGLTIFAADQQDIYVERTHPQDHDLYFDPAAPATAATPAQWRKMEIVEEELRVRGSASATPVTLKYTRHGPVIHEDHKTQRAYVLRWAGSEPGTAGYLGGIAISRARNWKEFREALRAWKLPPENFVYADVEGNIGYQAAALAPIRKNWTGLLPVPGDGSREWSGFYTLDDLPHEYNPPRGFVATANHRTIPADEKRVIGYDWSSPYRIDRINEVLAAAKKHTVADSQRLQADATSLAARELLALLPRVPAGSDERQRAIQLLKNWDARMERDSAAAVIYAVWMTRLRAEALRAVLGDNARQGGISQPTILRIVSDDAYRASISKAGAACDAACRDEFLGRALDSAIEELRESLGSDMSKWRWGALHTAHFIHALGNSAERAPVFNHEPVERAGDGSTPNAAPGPNYTQNHGASYRQVIDLADFDRSVAINTPGQSGQPESPHYGDLLKLWAKDEFFPLLFSRSAIEKNTKAKLLLVPKKVKQEPARP